MTQSTAAAERSAHVTRGPATRDAQALLREVTPGRYQLAAVSDAYRAGINAAAVELRRQAREMRQAVARDPTHACGAPLDRALAVLSRAAALEIAADSLAELPGGYEPSGLEYRGG